MPVERTPDHSRLVIDVEPELEHRIEAAAAERHLSVRDFVVTVLRRAVDADADDAAWSRLSARSFARDWESEADAVYDQPA